MHFAYARERVSTSLILRAGICTELIVSRLRRRREGKHKFPKIPTLLQYLVFFAASTCQLTKKKKKVQFLCLNKNLLYPSKRPSRLRCSASNDRVDRVAKGGGLMRARARFTVCRFRAGGRFPRCRSTTRNIFRSRSREPYLARYRGTESARSRAHARARADA